MKKLLIHKHFIEKPRFREDKKFAQSHSPGALTQPEATPKSRAYDIQHRKRIQVQAPQHKMEIVSDGCGRGNQV